MRPRGNTAGWNATATQYPQPHSSQLSIQALIKKMAGSAGYGDYYLENQNEKTNPDHNVNPVNLVNSNPGTGTDNNHEQPEQQHPAGHTCVLAQWHTVRQLQHNEHH